MFWTSIGIEGEPHPFIFAIIAIAIAAICFGGWL